MSASLSGHCLPPSSSLPPVRTLRDATEDQVFSALRNLQALYFPLRIPATLPTPKLRIRDVPPASTPTLADSGYASEDEDDEVTDAEEVLAALRADTFERTFATRWLTSLIARADELSFQSENNRSRAIDDAAFILSSFSDATDGAGEEALTRDFTFPTLNAGPVEVRLNDAPLSGTDHTDVGLQSWGASIILSGLMCSSPERFGLNQVQPGSSVIELGAGTGLVSLTLGNLFPALGKEGVNVMATDYHPAVLENLQANIVTNFPESQDEALGEDKVETMLLDWSAPSPSLTNSAAMLIAADVVYAPEHAAWLRDCAASLLVPGGAFWLMVTVRQNGKFEGIADTVEAAFDEGQCPNREDGSVFQILEKEKVEKKRGIGRGDESGYNLYRIGWA